MGLTRHHSRFAAGLNQARCLGIAACLFTAPTQAADPQNEQAALQTFHLVSGPLRIRNVNPIVQMYGIPRPVGATTLTEGIELSFNIEAANNFQSKDRHDTFVFLDGETYVTSYRLRKPISERWEWGAELPYIVHSGGTLDNLVEEFHELFGLPDGDRRLAARNQLDYLVRSEGVVYADFDERVRAVGDLRGFVGYQVFQQPRQAFALRGQIKIPTGKVEDLSGSEGTDISIWGEYQYDVVSSILDFTVTVSGGVSYLGEGEFIPDDQVSWLGFGHLGVQVPLHPRVEIHAQIDAHTDVLDTGNPLAAEGGLLGTLGGRIGITERLWLDLAVIEDLENQSASDVVFQILLGARF